ncbi:MAG TPA: mechanosensitive ion channel protein MscS [Algoriphagus sp.]|jgi:small-conductance mechanosensitive channel|uniref:mechanosensitive ion channel family protein n=2 Tax=Algoriphagus TaxID=246875 RepID=UPI000C8E2CEF|nr:MULTISPECIES: mechanosensitive ion channel domain-containing protein [unclassified Algoriphagus]MAN86176.1 mechanosensitive ion channel protein MscS [Algoriphagus sp.]HAD53530.1 mechanosensitive ion channel protein MscS [Algoriphagus sp.]HAH36529.1 mechanosensitive ion channel protein MscS [Algoriphagus sp.]HCD87260.1 mechanosensitive ion channel protein MscS [Algoriphagus sp.]HCH45881.1 mechanosensitive ion channel protein MscS [Algoriphagus sp.]|tara:strand:+ start:9353 stop:10255 length:903 start_codon:yes stop_codon:yes gene_type:complete
MQSEANNTKTAPVSNFIDWLEELLNISLINLGESKLTIGLLLTLIFSFIALFVISEWLRRLLVNKILKRYDITTGTRQSIGTMVKYLLILAGIFSILQTNGIDLSAFGVLAGAIGVGIGFGLQNVTNNFISGLIILFEQPIKVGDRIEVGDVTGDVIKISARSTMIVTNDNITIIVPNSQFIDSQVINWSHSDRMVRFNFPVGISYKENPQRVKEILLDVAKKNPGVLNTPETDVLFSDYGDNSINFTLRVWTSEYINRPNVLKSQLYYEVFKRFGEEGIEIPFPQRDLHLKSGFENLKN